MERLPLLLQTQGISKSFGPTRALYDVSMQLHAGQVHALVGENGAGKSTLFKICAGVIPRDRGSLQLNGVPYNPRNMRQAQEAGVALVFQEMTINPSLDIAENIYIDRMRQYAGPLGVTRWRNLRRSAQALLDELGANISVNQKLDQLDLGQRKVLEIARALSFRPKVLLLDESTAFLDTREIETLFKAIHTLREQGIAIGYISHHLDEIDQIADTITILKDGAWVGDYKRGELTNEQIEALMVGREIGEHIYPHFQLVKNREVALSLNNISIQGSLKPTTLEVYHGEILGLGGLKGAGGEALMRALVGDLKLTTGEMVLYGEVYKPTSPADAWKNGVAYLPGDRTGEGLIVDFAVRTNLSMASVPSRGPFVDRAGERNLVTDVLAQLQIKAESPALPTSSLSGGNMQKVVLGKCIAPKPRLLLLNNPTRGIDVGARMQIYSTIRNLADEGISVVLLSEDLLELIGMCDRLMILRKGEVNRAFTNEDLPSEKEIIGYMI
jgi:ribose transport system ATP-binding protein